MKAAVAEGLGPLKRLKEALWLASQSTAPYHAKVVSGARCFLDGKSKADRMLFKYFSVYFM
ncbi:hypothetical protein PC41400_27305 [Paenibacillus chitinolyticus]|uniref:Uncharacterized protein n=1 Tax=Paenibacillus chitinolyticus TaxID=79263 RepID=A0A410X3K8_9BACL|nr:hypothetical protein [Paenibacillus chitinolyticus]MCY9592960.1 hypothetical protein [Paenibacillus chitinolyticus]MCY9598970.1 hypothetical protein [Paenibacillus chitinolyticus]QAV21177.1 hypothetical protein PC41400_27305 [Paenibacillus chitinolyticus]